MYDTVITRDAVDISQRFSDYSEEKGDTNTDILDDMVIPEAR